MFDGIQGDKRLAELKRCGEIYKKHHVLSFALASTFVISLAAGSVILGKTGRTVPQDKKFEVGAPTPVKTVMPLYPPELEEDGVSGEVVICTVIDDEGRVSDVCFVVRPLHPELDRLSLKAVKQWKFKPYLYQGQPIPIPTYISIVFKAKEGSPGGAGVKVQGPSEEAGPENPPAGPLRNILNRAAEYCERLRGEALFYTCQEKTSESARKINEVEMSFNYLVLEQYVASARHLYPVLEGTLKAAYVNDYQLVVDEGRIKERRLLLEENGKRMRPETAVRKAPPLGDVLPILVPIQLLGREAQDSHSYTLTREETVRGTRSYVIEVKPRPGRKSNMKKATVWVDEGNYRILKAELESDAMPGYQWIDEECSQHYLTPHFRSRHSYEVEKDGILFPSRSEIRVEYTGLVYPPRDTKLRLHIRYEKYHFFTVETDHEIIRRELESSGTAGSEAKISSR